MQTIDYKAVIVDLERKRGLLNTRFDAAIAALRQVLAMENDSQPALIGVSVLDHDTLASGLYRGMSMLAAAVKHLQTVGHPVPNVQLAEQLELGGYRHKSKNFPNTLNSVLWRHAKSTGELRKVTRGWELVPK